MTTTGRPPAIAGVSSSREAGIAVVYPSIASTALGRTMGQLFDCLPDPVLGIKLSHWLILMPLFPLWAPLGATLYFYLKVFGPVYVLTNRSVQHRASLGNRLLREIPLTGIDDVVIRREPGQQFYPAADLDLVGPSGDVLMVLAGVPRADVFRQSIIEARNARRLVESSLKTIQARKPGA